MKRFGKLVVWVIWAVNALFTGLFLLVAFSPYIQPTEHPVLSCLGLAFPIFLLINVGFFLFWLLTRQFKFSLLSLAGLLIAFVPIRTYLPINFRTDEVPENSIKLLSYNIMCFGSTGPTKKEGKNDILTYLKESRADIICMQEYSTVEYSDYVSQKEVQETLSELPYHHIQNVGQYDKLACYSKFPILSARVLDYASDSNGSVLYEIKIGENTLTLINNHLESNKLTEADKTIYADILNGAEKEKVKGGARLLINKLAEATAIRAPQADTVAREVARSKHPYVVICGDFNDSPISYAHRVIARDLDDAFTSSGRGLGISYNRNKFYFRIDNILTSKNLKAYNCTVDRSIKASDHYPIYCFIKKRE